MKDKMIVLAGTDFIQCSVSTGGTLLEVDSDGQHISDVYVPPGRFRASFFMSQIGRGNLLVPGDGVYAFPPNPQSAPSDFGSQQYETAASQTFRIDRTEREKRRNDRLERMLNAQERRIALQERALSRAADPHREPEADLDEPDDEPAPEVVRARRVKAALDAEGA